MTDRRFRLKPCLVTVTSSETSRGVHSSHVRRQGPRPSISIMGRALTFVIICIYAVVPLAHEAFVEHRSDSDTRSGIVHLEHCEHVAATDLSRHAVSTACDHDHQGHECIAGLILRTACRCTQHWAEPALNPLHIPNTSSWFGIANRIDHRLAPKNSPPSLTI